jgi:hypothetical protein
MIASRPETTTLYRPVGAAELELIRASGFKAFPARLAHQPIFYPVVSEEYAAQIAREWNTQDAASGYVGHVTRFSVQSEFLSRYPVRRAGTDRHLEYWIPAEDLEEFNRNLIGRIEVTATYHTRVPQGSRPSEKDCPETNSEERG